MSNVQVDLLQAGLAFIAWFHSCHSYSRFRLPGGSMVDVLIITALPMEFDAAKAVGTAGAPGAVGVARWEPRSAGDMAPYLLGEFIGPGGVALSVALARSAHMGGRKVSPVTSRLVGELRPRCLAMSGVCAGNPARTALGDVIVPSLVYAFDEGKQTSAGFKGSHRHIPVDDRIVRAAQDLSTADLPSFKVPTAEEAKLWFLEQLLIGREPRDHPGRDRYYPLGAWKSSLPTYEQEGLITRQGGRWRLTDVGRALTEDVLYTDVDGPDTLPFKVVVGPMATGNVVMERPEIWDELGGMAVRDITGLEMEAAAIATVAETEQVPFVLIAKGVMDHALNKDDRYKRFAAKASAEVLFALLTRIAETIKRPTGDGTRAAEPDWRQRLGRRGLHIWTSAQFAVGLRVTEPAVAQPSFRQDEAINVFTLEAGRLPNLVLEFDGVGRAFDNWVHADHRKRGADGFRVLWLVSEEDPHRSKALLAALSRAQNAGRVVYDAGRDLELGAEAIRELGLAELPGAPALIAVDLPARQPSAGWIALLNALDALRRYENPDERPTTPSPDPVLVIAGTAAQEQLAYGVLQSAIEIDPVDVRGNSHQRPYSFAGTESLASPSVPTRHIFNRGLPKTAPRLFGRGEELDKLRGAWLDPEVRVMTVVAAGGVGKSALVNHWLRDLRDRDYLGAQRVLAWSFYSQGTKENLVAADVFVRFALDWLGDDRPLPTNPAEQGARLAALIRQHPMLLLLDGLEPLQYPETAPDVGGTLTDISIASLLRELAAPGWEGLCLITTRVPVAGIKAPDSAAAAIEQLDLRNLDIPSGVSLLESLIGRQQNIDEAEQAVAAVHGHALALNLLGRYLREVYGGRLSGRFGMGRLGGGVAEGGHAQRIMELYAEWLQRYARIGELAILDVIGLFDRPAPFPAIAAVLARTDLGREMPGLSEFDGSEWRRCVADLRRMGLLADETAGLPGTLDAHPLVREYFRSRLQLLSPALWEAGNLSLYEYYKKRAPEQPANAADMNLLYAAVNHGCAIGRHQEVYHQILVPRIWRSPRESYSTRILGMTGSEIVALSNYFLLPAWTKLRSVELDRQARVLVMSNAALRLRQLGRPDDALASCRALFGLLTAKATVAEPVDVADAAYAASLYCELLIIAGRLQSPVWGKEDGAPEVARTAVRFADQCPDAYFKMYSRSCLAEVEFMTGDLNAARELFDEAAAIAVAEQSNLPFLYSQNLYRYGYFAIETGDAAILLADAERDPRWGLAAKPSQLSHAIRQLVLGAARRAMAEAGEPADLAQAAAEVDDAIVIFRGVGYTDYTVRGLLERAHLRQVRARPEDYAGALDDLDEAQAEVTRSHMTLLAADVHLQKVACHLSVWPRQPADWHADMRGQVAASLNEASNLVGSLGYRRRNGLVRRLTAQCREYGIIVS
jgi:nucleoside phosphorylase